MRVWAISVVRQLAEKKINSIYPLTALTGCFRSDLGLAVELRAIAI